MAMFLQHSDRIFDDRRFTTQPTSLLVIDLKDFHRAPTFVSSEFATCDSSVVQIRSALASHEFAARNSSETTGNG